MKPTDVSNPKSPSAQSASSQDFENLFKHAKTLRSRNPSLESFESKSSQKEAQFSNAIIRPRLSHTLNQDLDSILCEIDEKRPAKVVRGAA